jgi:hypothetical protein
MQPSDVISLAENVARVIATVVFVFAAFRAFTIGRAQVNRVYRNRAFFTGVFALVLSSSGILSLTPVGDDLYATVLFVLFVLFDTTILVALERDFFHRNTLRWKPLRYVGYALLGFEGIGGPILEIALLLGWITQSTMQSITNSTANLVLFLSGLSFLGYAIGAAVVSARRTSDKTLKKFVVFAGLLILAYVVNSLLFLFVSQVFGIFDLVVYAYITYLMAMSLSPVGKVEKEIKR